MEEKKKKFPKVVVLYIIIVILIIISLGEFVYYKYEEYSLKGLQEENNSNVEYSDASNTNNTDKISNSSSDKKTNEEKSEYKITGNSIQDFDIKFLKLEKSKENKIYSPLSIKYALGMLKEGASGNTYTQLSSVIGDYKAKKYTNSENLSFANAFFVKDSFKDGIKEEYINSLKDKFDAEVIYDSFESANTINTWVNNKTLKLISNLVNDEDAKKLDYTLVNALGIDMEWEDKFLDEPISGYNPTFEEFSWKSPQNLLKGKFENVNGDISGMGIVASVNKYDAIKIVGEENIRKKVEEKYRQFINEKGNDSYTINELRNKGKDDETIIKEYIDGYIEEVKSYYGDVSKNVDFSFYNDENVKVFAKDLKEYNGTTLQYVGIMPVKEDLDKYIESLDAKQLNKVVSNIKEIKQENFDDDVITVIKGYIPKFKFDYSLNLKEDLKQLGITDVFDENKSDLSKMTTSKASLDQVLHKANIEFTQDGIKAAAATVEGGFGAGCEFLYTLGVKVKEIDLTFNKPYMFLIRDKATGEVWFTGTVYTPYSIDNENGEVFYEDFVSVNYSDKDYVHF